MTRFYLRNANQLRPVFLINSLSKYKAQVKTQIVYLCESNCGNFFFFWLEKRQYFLSDISNLMFEKRE